MALQQRTPPPDNYGHIPPCSHLTLVLDSKAHDTLLTTYRQAVAIAIAINPLLLKHVVYTHKKDGLAVPAAKLAEYKAATLRCAECTTTNYHQVLICLQCPHVGCYHSHARTHAKSSGHVFAIDSHTGLLYCFLCGDYINHRDLYAIRLASVERANATGEPQGEGALHRRANGMANGSGASSGSDIDPLPGYSKPPPAAVHGLKGIVNLGSTCFMSCILQTLLHNPLVCYHFFNSDAHFFNCALLHRYNSPSAAIDEHSACITCLLDAMFKEFYTSPSHDGFGISNLLMTAWYKNQLLAGFQEQDAHEFWQFLLSELHSDHERVLSDSADAAEALSDSESHSESHSHSSTQCKCVMHSTFSGQLESSVACGSCGAVTRTVDPLIDLSLEINHLNSNPSLYDCLDQFTHNEALDVKYKCQSCRKESKAHRSLRIKKIPPVLSIQLKRFKHNFANDTASKIDTKVEAPLFLNLTKYASDYGTDAIDTNKVYELFAIVNHVGLVNTGHYIALVKNSTGQWFKFDDSVISLISHEEVQATNAYLLFYIAHNI